jgi:hypothetical protein
MPSTYAPPHRLRRLKALLRRTGRVLHSGPDIANPRMWVLKVANRSGAAQPLKTHLL